MRDIARLDFVALLVLVTGLILIVPLSPRVTSLALIPWTGCVLLLVRYLLGTSRPDMYCVPLLVTALVLQGIVLAA